MKHLPPPPILVTPQRVSGFVTQKLINEHGSFRAALAHINANTPKQERRAR